MAKDKSKDMGIVKEIQKVLLDDEDFVKLLLQENLQKFLNAEFDNYIQALPYERTDKRKGYRNGSYFRRVKTRVGSIELEIMRDREGEFNTELFRRYQRSEQAFVLSMIEMYINGVSTRKVKKIVEKLCGLEISKSTVSNLSKELDENIKNWRNRKIVKDYPYLIIDARYEDIRCCGIVKNHAVLIAIGISDTGHREILSLDVGNSENKDSWADIFKGLKTRGLRGLQYIVSDAHSGLVSALKREFSGVAWQRCQVHFIRNYMLKIGKRDQKENIAKLKDIFLSPDIETARKRKNKLVKDLETKKPKVAEWLDEEIESCFSVYALPIEHRKRMRTTNMIERFNQELLRRSRVVRIFPNEDSCIRLFSAMCMEKSDEWQTGIKYLNMELLSKQNQEKSTGLSKVV